MKTLQDLFLAELAGLYDVEIRLISALPKMAKAATCDRLQQTILGHLEETKGHVERVEKIFECFGFQANRASFEGTAAILRDGDDITNDLKDSPAINAALIAIVQKVGHYEIASYGCLRAWAGELGSRRASDLLKEILVQEIAVDESLSDLAFSICNPDALGELADEEDQPIVEPVSLAPIFARELINSI